MIKCINKDSKLHSDCIALNEIAPIGSYICMPFLHLMNCLEIVGRCGLVGGSVGGAVSLEVGCEVKKPTPGPVSLFLLVAY